MKNKVEVVHIISGITLILISLFLVVYYNLIIDKGVVNIAICNKVNILDILSGFI